MANIGEALTIRLARERLEAIKKFLPVRDSVRQKLQARQQAREGYAEATEELFKHVTAATETVKTAITRKPGLVDPDKPQQSLLQAIEGLKQTQFKSIKGFNYETDFKDTFVAGIKTLSVRTFEDAYKFGEHADTSYHSRELFLKHPEQKVDRQRFLDGIYKINKGIKQLDTSDRFYQNYLKGANQYQLLTKEEKELKSKLQNQRKLQKVNRN